MKNTFINTISNDDLKLLPTIQFGGRVVVVDSDEELLDQACNDLMRYNVVGFDTETRPTFKPGALNKVALLQLSTPDVCYLFRLCSIRLDKAILKILISKNILKIGADVPGDIKALQKLRHFTPGGFVDLQNIVSEWGIGEKSVRKMSAIVLGERVSKAQRLSNWEAQTLTQAQQLYAATDAWVCTMIYNKLLSTDKK